MTAIDVLNSIRNGVENIDETTIKNLEEVVSEYDDIIIIGNGGSNAIASHISIDYTKFLNKRCMSFSDAPRLTCYMNDYGIDEAYVKFLDEFSNMDTLVILISSSGNSKNIVNSCRYCSTNNIPYVTMTGFEPDNKVRSLYSELAEVDIWVNSKSYGVVECVHEICLHSLVDN
tara:strand:- start:259 stop:777 length:519 start_codon:yes stop_codon:yes gene_type:complete